MTDVLQKAVSRRAMISTGLLLAGTIGLAPRTLAAPLDSGPFDSAPTPRGIRPALFRRAMAALHQHGGTIAQQDRIAIADFAAPSARPRFHLVNLADGTAVTLLVAHGSGSDPDHTGWLKRFSNEDGSNASSEGAFVTANYYLGKHGQSQRLNGLDSTNSNAFARALVIHGAWYANPDMLEKHGQLGRSQGCFAVGEADLAQVFARLGEGRMVYATNV